MAERIAAAVSQLPDGVLAAAILHGSLTLGDYVPGRSDVDVLLVVDRPLRGAEVAALERAVDESSAGLDGLDLRVITGDVASTPEPAPPLEAYLERRPGRPELRLEAPVPAEPDAVVELSICRAHGRSLVGPPPGELIGAVPDEWVLEVGDAHLARWQEVEHDPAHAELMVLTACRIWRFAEERRHCSKTAAGEWALGRSAGDEVVRAALRSRRGQGTATIEEADVRQLLTTARECVARASG